MINLAKIIIIFILVSYSLACSSASEKQDGVDSNINSEIENSTPVETPKIKRSVKFVDVPKLANRSAGVFDEVFGEPLKTTPIEDNPRLMPGEFREYEVAGHPKNLSVRFYKDKAKRFNLLLGKPEKSSSKSLKKIFRIDVGRLKRVKSDGLSETWKGRSGSINYKTAYAKRSRSGGDFVMLHAEIE